MDRRIFITGDKRKSADLCGVIITYVILSEAKNLLRIAIGFKILRFAQNDNVAVADVKNTSATATFLLLNLLLRPNPIRFRCHAVFVFEKAVEIAFVYEAALLHDVANVQVCVFDKLFGGFQLHFVCVFEHGQADFVFKQHTEISRRKIIFCRKAFERDILFVMPLCLIQNYCNLLLQFAMKIKKIRRQFHEKEKHY